VTTGIESKILKRLEEWEGKEGPLPKSLESYRRLLGIQSEAKLRIGIPRPSLSSEVISNRMMAGQPLLEFNDLSIDWLLVQDIFEDVSIFLSSYSVVSTEVRENLKKSSSDLDFLKEITEIWFEGVRLPPLAAVSGANEALWEFTIHAALRPFLVRHREALLNSVNQELWRRGYCPICGGSPDFAFLDKERGARWLLCSRCDAEWLFQRLECPYCGTQDQGALAYFTDDKGLYRLYVCERCRRYLKTIDLRQAKDEVLIPLERFLTLDLDVQAHRDGYTPGKEVGQDHGMEKPYGATILAKEEDRHDILDV
jgi:FdhE protein